jgi:anti-anti-sigma factor
MRVFRHTFRTIFLLTRRYREDTLVRPVSRLRGLRADGRAVPMSSMREREGEIRLAPAVAGVATVGFSGSFDLADVARIEEALRRSMRTLGPGTLELDATEMDFCDCAVLRVLVGAHGEATSRGNRVVIVAASPALRWLLVTCGLTELFGYSPARSRSVPGPGVAEESTG